LKKKKKKESVIISEPEPVFFQVQFQGPYAKQLETLSAMGFTDVGVNTALLRKYKGNVQRVVPVLLESSK